MSEEAYNAVKELLPNIEKELREEIFTQLQEEYTQRLEDQIKQSQEEEIEKQTYASFQEKIAQLDQKENQLNEEKNQIDTQIRLQVESEFKQKFEQEKQTLKKQVQDQFNDQIIVGEVEEKLRENIRMEMEEQMRKDLEKKEKLLKINFRKKQEQEKKILEEGFEIEWRQKIDAEKKLIEKEKSDIARLRSLENIRLKKLEDEKKNFRQQMKEQEQKYQDIIQSMQQQIIKLQDELQLLQKQQIQQYSSKKIQNESMDNSTPVNKFERQKKFSVHQKDHNESFIPFYQHKNMFDQQSLPQRPQQDIKLVHQIQDKDLILEEVNPTPDNRKAQNLNFNLQNESSDIHKYLFGEKQQFTASNQKNEQPKIHSLFNKESAKTFVSKYQEQLNKLLQKSEKENKQINMVNQNVESQIFLNSESPKINNKYDEILMRKQKDDQVSHSLKSFQQKIQSNNYEQVFNLNEFDNEHNQQMKTLRKEIQIKLQKNQQNQQKFEAQEIYMKTDFLQRFKRDKNISEFKNLLEQIFYFFEILNISYQERVDFIKYLQNQTQPDLGSVIPFLQQKIIHLKQLMIQLPQRILDLLDYREDLKKQISLNFESFTKSKNELIQLKEIDYQLKGSKQQWKGQEIDKLIQVDLWEMEYLQREELKNQMLQKIQAKIL